MSVDVLARRLALAVHTRAAPSLSTRRDCSAAQGGGVGVRAREGRPRRRADITWRHHGGGEERRGELLRQGRLISSTPDARRRLTDYFTKARPERHARCVLRTGWHNGAGVFVFPHKTVGDSAEAVLYQADSLEAN